MMNIKRLMLSTALFAILSCTSSNEDPYSGRPYINPDVPTPSLSTSPRFSRTDLSTLNGGGLDIFSYKVVGEDGRVISLGTPHTTTKKTEYTVGDKEIGFLIDRSSGLHVPTPTTMNVKAGGVAINFTEGDSDKVYFSNEPQSKVRDILTKYMGNIENLTVNMSPGSYFLMLSNANLVLSKTSVENILSGIPVNSRPKINGTGYEMVKFDKAMLLVDQDVNLDDPNDPYNRITSKMTNSSVSIELNKTIKGTKDNQIGAKITLVPVIGFFGSSKKFNEGTINLKGNNSIGVFARNTDFKNLGSISVGKNSTGIHLVVDASTYGLSSLGLSINKILNERQILTGENSTGIYLDKIYYDITGTMRNAYGATIESYFNNVIGMSANVGEGKLTSETPSQYDLTVALNSGDIRLGGDKSIGIYVTGKGTAYAENDESGKIRIERSYERNNPGIGMYSDNAKAILTNKGRIEIGNNSVGMAGVNGNIIQNDGTITINGEGGIGMYIGNGSVGTNNGTITTSGSPKNVVGVVVGTNAEFTNNGNINIDSSGGAGIVIAGGTVKNYGKIQVSGGAVRDRVETAEKEKIQIKANRATPVKSDLGIYVDTQGKTNPIQGIENLNIKNADLLIGAEATELTSATEVKVPENVLKPFTDSIENSGVENWNIKSDSAVWEADSKIENNKVKEVTLKKQSYTKFSNDEKTEAVARGLDEKYAVTSVESKDKQIFNQLNALNNAQLLTKTYREIAGNQYINVQQRIIQTDDILDRELSSLQKENLKTGGHHISTFAGKNMYESTVPEIANSKSTNYGAAYLFNDADNKYGFYAGTIFNKFKLEDHGKSKENMTMLKFGAYKTFKAKQMDWTLAVEGFGSQNEMKRRIIVGGNIYENKADYNAYGFTLKNELSRTYEMGENLSVRPYSNLRFVSGKFSDIKEKNSTLGLEVKGNNYIFVKPSLGVEFGYTNQITSDVRFKASLDLAYEYESGKVKDHENEARFSGTSNGWIKLESHDDTEHDFFRTDLKIGLETGNLGISLNGGYNTKNKNAHIGIGFGASF